MNKKKKNVIVVMVVITIILITSCSTTGDLKAPENKGPRLAEFRDQVYNRQIEFEKLDANDDGFITLTEYNGTEALFNGLDLDGDGRISLKEAKYMITFAEIPAGTFVMGSPEPLQAFFEPSVDCLPEHQVTLDAYKMSATEVTNEQYVMFLNAALETGDIEVSLDPEASIHTRIDYPVATWTVYAPKGHKYEGRPYVVLSPLAPLSHHHMDNGLLLPEHPLNLSWINYLPQENKFEVYPGFEDWPASHIRWWGAIAYAEYYGLSLPTEAEWEYAAKGGKDFIYATDDGTISGKKANYACYNVLNIPSSFFKGDDSPEDFIGFRYTVGTYPSNPFGLYDMAGNVWEWTLDWYSETFYQELIDKGITKNPLNDKGIDPPFNSFREGVKQGLTGGPGQVFSHDSKVCRGGSWNYHEAVTHNEYRFPVYHFIANDHFGFRVVLRPESTKFNQ